MVNEIILYCAHLHNSLLYNRQNSLSQKNYLGDWISKIGNYNFEESINDWYKQLFDYINEHLPEYYVKTLVIYENTLGIVKKIEYLYFERSVLFEDVTNTSIIIHRE